MTTTASTSVEWATIALGKVVIATNERVWLDSPLDDQERFAKLTTGTGNTAITRNLLDGAMAAAKVAIPSGNKPPTLTPNLAVAFVVSQSKRGGMSLDAFLARCGAASNDESQRLPKWFGPP